MESPTQVRGGAADPGARRGLRSAAVAKALARRQSTAALTLELASDALARLERGGHVFGLTKGQFSMIDIASALLDKVGPARVSVWTWCIAAYEIEAFTAFMRDSRITQLRMVMDYSAARRDQPLLAEMQHRFGVECLRVAKTHAKILTIASESGWRLVARGSMNLNFNPRFEQFDVSDGGGAFDVMAEIEAEIWRNSPALPVARVSHDKAVDVLAIGGQPDVPGWAAAAASVKQWW
jgi:hypothetical protein